jgi:hypothetical protein
MEYPNRTLNPRDLIQDVATKDASAYGLWGYGEQSQDRDTPFLAGGPLRIPAENFQLRVRKETDTKDTANARLVETWTAQVPIQQEAYYRTDLPDGGIMTAARKRNAPKRDSRVPAALQAKQEDMMPLSSRTDKRDFRQSRPYDPAGPGLSLNPYFDRYDPTRDPRNTIREVRSVVYETKEPERGQVADARMRERNFSNRYDEAASTRLTQAHELLRPKIDSPEVVYRSQSQLWKYGSPV